MCIFLTITDLLLRFLVPVGVVLVAVAVMVLLSGKGAGYSESKVVEAERKRKECPDIQSGMFTRLYTMPYDESLTGYAMQAYIEANYPHLYCSGADECYIQIRQNDSVLSEEVRKIFITHYPNKNITSIELSDPNEYEHLSDRTPRMRTSADKGFNDDVRAVIRYFQTQAIAQDKQS